MNRVSLMDHFTQSSMTPLTLHSLGSRGDKSATSVSYRILLDLSEHTWQEKTTMSRPSWPLHCHQSPNTQSSRGKTRAQWIFMSAHTKGILTCLRWACLQNSGIRLIQVDASIKSNFKGRVAIMALVAIYQSRAATLGRMYPRATPLLAHLGAQRTIEYDIYSTISNTSTSYLCSRPPTTAILEQMTATGIEALK